MSLLLLSKVFHDSRNKYVSPDRQESNSISYYIAWHQCSAFSNSENKLQSISTVIHSRKLLPKFDSEFNSEMSGWDELHNLHEIHVCRIGLHFVLHSLTPMPYNLCSEMESVNKKELHYGLRKQYELQSELHCGLRTPEKIFTGRENFHWERKFSLGEKITGKFSLKKNHYELHTGLRNYYGLQTTKKIRTPNSKLHTGLRNWLKLWNYCDSKNNSNSELRTPNSIMNSETIADSILQ